MFDSPKFWQVALSALAAVIAAVVVWLLGRFGGLLLDAFTGARPITRLKSRWRHRRAKLIPLQAYPVAGEDDGMRKFTIRKIKAYDSKGKRIVGTIEPVHTDYWLDLEGTGKMHLFALARQGRSLEKAYSLNLEVASSTGDKVVWQREDVSVKVLFTDVFGVEQVTEGDYWDTLPESLRDDIQDKLADELMGRAQPELRGSLFKTWQEPYPYQGVTFAVSELDELEALFPPE